MENIYKFYSTDAFLKQKNESEVFSHRFGISSKTYDEAILMNNDIAFSLLMKRNKFDIIEPNADTNTDIPMDLALALDYNEYHPDEVVFVTTDTDKNMVDLAKEYFDKHVKIC